jgi:hypothetical protein
MSTEHSDLETVQTLLRLAKLSPSQAEVEAMAAGFAQARAGVDLLYAVSAARYEEPATVFKAVV